MIAIRPSRADDLGALFRIWQSAVDATHDFLKPADRAAIGQLVRDHYLPSTTFTLAVDEANQPIGFLGSTGDKIDALFVDPRHHGRGVGGALVQAFQAGRGALSVDVNEQNSQATSFYMHLGFEVIERSDVDDAGMPYPLLRLRRKAPREALPDGA